MNTVQSEVNKVSGHCKYNLKRLNERYIVYVCPQIDSPLEFSMDEMDRYMTRLDYISSANIFGKARSLMTAIFSSSIYIPNASTLQPNSSRDRSPR